MLSASTGNILEDESAISVITEAKRLGNDIAAKQKQGEVTEAAIDEARVAYTPCGDYLSTLFFCISGTHERLCDMCAILCTCGSLLTKPVVQQHIASLVVSENWLGHAHIRCHVAVVIAHRPRRH